MKERKIFHDIRLSIWPVYTHSQEITVLKTVRFIATSTEALAHSKLCYVILQNKAAGNNTFIRKIQETSYSYRGNTATFWAARAWALQVGSHIRHNVAFYHKLQLL